MAKRSASGPKPNRTHLVSLPAVQATSRSGAWTSSGHRPGEHAVEKASVLVLIAEDQSEIRIVLQDSFEDGGFAVLLAATAEEAMAAMDARSHEIRALITDIKLGADATGWDVARHARRLNPELPVVYITGSESQDWAVMGVPNSVLIPKPFAPAQLLTAVSQLLNAGNTPGA